MSCGPSWSTRANKPPVTLHYRNGDGFEIRFPIPITGQTFLSHSDSSINSNNLLSSKTTPWSLARSGPTRLGRCDRRASSNDKFSHRPNGTQAQNSRAHLMGARIGRCRQTTDWTESCEIVAVPKTRINQVSFLLFRLRFPQALAQMVNKTVNIVGIEPRSLERPHSCSGAGVSDYGMASEADCAPVF